MSNHPSWNEIECLRTQLMKTNIEYWYKNNLFSFPWWFLLMTMVLFILTTWVLIDRAKIVEMLLCGFMATTIIVFLDVVGVSFLLWGYPNMLIPLIPPIFSIDMTHLPVVYMLLYQYCPSWKSYLIAITAAAFVFSFVFEPVAMWLNIYDMNHWKHIYSFPIYIAIGVFLKWVMIKIKAVETLHKKTI